MRGRLSQKTLEFLFPSGKNDANQIVLPGRFHISPNVCGGADDWKPVYISLCCDCSSSSRSRVPCDCTVPAHHSHTFEVWVLVSEGSFVCNVKDPWMRRVQAALTFLSKVARASDSASATSPAPSEERKKGTDEVAEFTTGTSQDVHGGDSASEEVPDGLSKTENRKEDNDDSKSAEDEETKAVDQAADASGSIGGESPNGGERSLPHGGLGSNAAAVDSPGGAGSSPSPEPGQSGEGCAAPDTTADANAASASRDAEVEGTEGLQDIKSDVLARESDEDSVPSLGGAEKAKAEEAPERAEEVRNALRQFSSLRRSGQSGRASGPSTAPRYSHGGVFASLSNATAPSPAIVARARRALARMVRGGETDAGPRWNARRVAIKVAGYLRQWDVRDRKEEDGRPAILVLPDVSGSMSAFAAEVLRLADAVRRVGVPGADVIVVTHSNGYPEEWAVNAEPVRSTGLVYGADLRARDFYQDLIRRYNVRAVVVAADWDGAWLYRELAEAGLDIYWLDVWSCSRMSPRPLPFPPRFVGTVEWSKQAISKVRYAVACRTAEDAVNMLERIIVIRRW